MLTKLPEKGASIGLGDRIGTATPGHAKAVSSFEVFPVFAQQSARELSFTGRSFKDVIDDAIKGIKKAEFKGNFGFDGDHLKTEEDIERALNAGITMLTLDCSDRLNAPSDMERELFEEFKGEKAYLGKLALEFSEEELSDFAKTYAGVIEKTLNIWDKYLKKRKKVSLELSIDETDLPTAPKAHYFIASALLSRGVKLATLAPKFPGAFEKGVNYRGNLSEFRNALYMHHQIASRLGYRLSIHSGSDKFSIFPIIGKLTGGNFHIKTSGTSYLQALKLIGEKEKELLTEIWELTLSRFSEAKKLYKISANPDELFPTPDSSKLLENEKARQILHVSYIFVLNPESPIREKFFRILKKYEEEYHELVAKHIEKHLVSLGIKRRR